MRSGSADARKHEREFNRIISQFKSGNFSDAERLEGMTDALLYHDLEGIKRYAERDEYERLGLLERFFEFLLRRHASLGSEARKRLQSDIRRILADLRTELKSERRLSRGSRPKAGLLDRFRSERALAKRSRKLSADLAVADEEIDSSVKDIVHAARNGRFQDLQDAAIRLSALLLEFFDTALEIEEEAELQEYWIINSLREAMEQAEKLNNKEIKHLLEKIIRKAMSFYRKDFWIAKKEYLAGKKLSRLAV